MQLVTFEHNGSAKPGVRCRRQIIGLQAAGFSTLLHLIQGGSEALQRIKTWVDNPPKDEIVPLANARILALCQIPKDYLCGFELP